MSAEIENLIAKKFISRRDIKAVQISNGEYRPVDNPWTREDIASHLNGERTFGHYMLSEEGNCKLIGFDIDIEQRKPNHPVGWLPTDEEFTNFYECNARDIWRDRTKTIERTYLKYELRMLVHQIVRNVQDLLQVPVAAAYTGYKGVHVYAFTGPISGTDARDGAEIVLGDIEGISLVRGNNFYGPSFLGPGIIYSNLSVEIYPKQSSLDGQKLGNLMRLPLGRNQKSKDPTFFMDLTAAMGQLVPLSPLIALSDDYNPWTRYGG